jgi:uncharacterized damage-inducible protein DinB
MPKNVAEKTMTEISTDFKEEFLRTWEREYQTTLKLLKAYPENKLDLRPHDKLRTAGELIWEFTNGEAWMINGCLTGRFDVGNSMEPPSTKKEIIDNFEKVHSDSIAKIRRMSESDLNKQVKFFVAPKQMGEVKCWDLLTMMVMDQVHHRGQLTIYTRIAGGVVPSIYGPTFEEPWM